MKKLLLFIPILVLFLGCEKNEPTSEEPVIKDEFNITSFEIQNEPIASGQLINASSTIDRPEVYEYEVTYNLYNSNGIIVSKANGFKANVETAWVEPGKYKLKLSVHRLKTGEIKTKEKEFSIITALFDIGVIGNSKEKIIETIKNIYKQDKFGGLIGLSNPLFGQKDVNTIFFKNIGYYGTIAYLFKENKLVGGEIYTIEGMPFTLYTSYVDIYSKKFNDKGISLNEMFYYFTKESLDKLVQEGNFNLLNTIMTNGQYYVTHEWNTQDYYAFLQPMNNKGVINFYFYKK